MKKIVIASACRTAIGKFGGTLANVPATELGSIVIKEALNRANVKPEQVDHVYMGCVIQAGLGQNVARQAALKAGLPIETPAVTVNVVCGSGLNCVNMAAQMIEAGDADIVVAGGMENTWKIPITKSGFSFSRIIFIHLRAVSSISSKRRPFHKFSDNHTGIAGVIIPSTTILTPSRSNTS